MRDGMYGLTFQAIAGKSNGSLVLQNGKIFGIDEGGALYDGTYSVNADGRTALNIKASMPANVASVLGVSAPEAWSIDLSGTADLNPEQGQIEMDTPVGQPVAASYRFLRTITPAA
jgi:hypothetical protein